MVLILKHRIQSYPKEYAMYFCMAVALKKFRSPIFELTAAGHGDAIMHSKAFCQTWSGVTKIRNPT